MSQNMAVYFGLGVACLAANITPKVGFGKLHQDRKIKEGGWFPFPQALVSPNGESRRGTLVRNFFNVPTLVGTPDNDKLVLNR